MKKYCNIYFFLSVLSILLFVSSCTSKSYQDSTAGNTAIARLYIGLSSKQANEDYESELVEEIISSHFDGATIQESKGIYQGKVENSLIITIINCCRWEMSKGDFRNKIQNLAIELKHKLSQESILIEYITTGKNEAFEIYN